MYGRKMKEAEAPETGSFAGYPRDDVEKMAKAKGWASIEAMVQGVIDKHMERYYGQEAK